MKLYEFTCDGRDNNGNECDDGTITVPGDYPTPPLRETCKKCNGTGKMFVKKEYIDDLMHKKIAEIETLTEEIEDLADEVEELEKLLSPTPSWGGPVEEELSVGDWVIVTKRSTKYNPHIDNVGFKGKITEMRDDVVQIEGPSGCGAVDIDCVKLI